MIDNSLPSKSESVADIIKKCARTALIAGQYPMGHQNERESKVASNAGVLAYHMIMKIIEPSRELLTSISEANQIIITMSLDTSKIKPSD